MTSMPMRLTSVSLFAPCRGGGGGAWGGGAGKPDDIHAIAAYVQCFSFASVQGCRRGVRSFRFCGLQYLFAVAASELLVACW